MTYYAIAGAPRWRRALPRRRRGPGRRFKGGLHKRPRLSSKLRRRSPRTWTKRVKREGAQTGYLQWSRLKRSTGRRVRSATLDKRLVRANREYAILGFRQLKAFDDFGAVPIHSKTVGDVAYVPIHCYLLNGQNSYNNVTPGRQLWYDDVTKQWKWALLAGLNPAGSASNYLQTIYQSGNSNSRMSRRYHEYSHVKMNVWGAKNKATRWTIEIVQPLSDEVNPFHWQTSTPMGSAAAQAWEELVKQYTYNPIAKIDHYIKRNFRVVKSMSFIISPTMTTEADVDPHVKTIDWFMRVNKLVNFDKATVNNSSGYVIPDADNLKNVLNPELGISEPASDIPRDKQCMLLLVRCSDYSAPVAFTNELHGSYDIDFRTKFTQLG